MGGQSSLSKYAHLMAEPQDGAAFSAAKDAYLKSGGELVLINKKWLRNWADRKQLDLLAVAALGVKGEGK